MGTTLLIAEDEKIGLKILTKYFSLQGFTVYPASTCAEAVKLAEQHLPDCFPLDYHLTDGTAEEICRFIRCNAYLAKAPIVILSGDSEQSVYCYDICKADAFVEKGKSPAEALAALNRYLSRAESERKQLKKSDLTLNLANMTIYQDDGPAVSLSPEQFRFFSILFEKSSRFVSEEEICSLMSGINLASITHDGLNMLAYRLRRKLGARLAKRIKKKKRLGWIYVQPRDRRLA